MGEFFSQKRGPEVWKSFFRKLPWGGGWGPKALRMRAYACAHAHGPGYVATGLKIQSKILCFFSKFGGGILDQQCTTAVLLLWLQGLVRTIASTLGIPPSPGPISITDSCLQRLQYTVRWWDLVSASSFRTFPPPHTGQRTHVAPPLFLCCTAVLSLMLSTPFRTSRLIAPVCVHVWPLPL